MPTMWRASPATSAPASIPTTSFNPSLRAFLLATRPGVFVLHTHLTSHMMYSNTERKMEEVNFELQVAVDEALEAEMFDRWVEEVAISFLSSEDIYDEMAA